MRETILIVDDEESISFALRAYLQRAGYAVDVASGLAEAKAKVDLASYQLVISDLRLTDLRDDEGFELLSYLRANHPATRTLLLSAYLGPQALAESALRGASLVLPKPQALAKLREHISRLLEIAP